MHVTSHGSTVEIVFPSKSVPTSPDQPPVHGVWVGPRLRMRNPSDAVTSRTPSNHANFSGRFPLRSLVPRATIGNGRPDGVLSLLCRMATLRG
jgi:hypothetical protein